MAADIFLGHHTQHEVPQPITVTFHDDTGVPLADMTGWSAQFVIRRVGGTPVVRTASISDGPGAQATYTWQEADFETAGVYEADMVVATVNVRPISQRLWWRVRPALQTTAPTIGP